MIVSLIFVTFGESIIANSVGADVIRAHPQLSALGQAYANVPYLALFLIPLLFPDGRFVPRWTRWLSAFFVYLFTVQAIAAGPALDLSRAPGWLVGPLNLFVLG